MFRSSSGAQLVSPEDTSLSKKSRGGRAAGNLLAAFFLGWVFMYADRAVLSPVIGDISDEFEVSLTQIGLLSGGFFFAYAALQVPFGLLATRVGRRRLLISGFALFGATTALSAGAPTFEILLTLSVITGVGQATYYPTQFAIAADAIPSRGRAFGLAIINNGMAVGVAGGTFFASILASYFALGWRVSFLVMGILTLLTAGILSLVINEPPRRVDRTVNKRRFRLFSRPQVAAYVGGFCSLYGFFLILVWLPYYLTSARGFSNLEGSMVALLATLPAIPASLAMGRLSDASGSRRGLLLGLFPVAAISLAFVPLADSTPLLLGSLALYGVSGKLVVDPIIAAHLADVTPRDDYSAGYGILNFAGMLSSVIAPIATAWIADASGSMNIGFYVASLLLIVGLIAMVVFGGPVSPPRSEIQG